MTVEDREWLWKRVSQLYGGPIMVSRGKAHDMMKLPGLMAWRNQKRVGVVVYHVLGEEVELVLLDAIAQWQRRIRAGRTG